MAVSIFQGEDKTINVTSNIDLTSATEIEFTIDTPTQIKKTLSDAQISAVTTEQFTVQVDAADTETLMAGEYKFQVRATINGAKTNGKFSPDKLKILDSVFTTVGSSNDYN